MDKSTDSTNSSGSHNGNPAAGDATTPKTRDSSSYSLGCGPAAGGSSSSSRTSATSTTSSSSSSASTTAHASSATSSRATIPLPLGAPLPTALQLTASNTTAALSSINLNISTTTGGNFGVNVEPNVSVETLKKIIAKKLKVAKDRICLLHREKELQDGTLKENNLMDGSKIILIPSVETGLLAQRPENTVMQALESLNDTQVNDFLSGKTPLNLSMRLGDHMMLIQLQLSTVNPANGASAAGCSSASRTRSSLQRASRSSSSVVAAAGSGGAATVAAHHNHHNHHHHHHHHHNSNVAINGAAAPAVMRKGEVDTNSSSGAVASCLRPSTSAAAAAAAAASRIPASATSSPSTALAGLKSSDLSSFLSKRDYESLQNIVKSIAMAQPARLASLVPSGSSGSTTTATTTQLPQATPVVQRSVSFRAPTTVESALLEQSPIKSLSNLVSSPIKTTPIKNIPIASGSSSSSISNAASPPSTPVSLSAAAAASAAAACQDPISAKLTSCLCTRLNGGGGSSSKSCYETTCATRQEETPQATHHQPRSALITSTPNNKTLVAVSSPTPSTSSLHKTANNPIARPKHRHHHHHHHHHHHYHHHGNSGGAANTAAGALSPVVRAKLPTASPAIAAADSNDSALVSDDSGLVSTSSTNSTTTLTPSPLTPNGNSNSSTISSSSSSSSMDLDDSGLGVVSDTRTLAEASRNLTQTLRKLSKEVFTNKIDLSSNDESPRKSGSGAVIESMKNHGKGIYSGTFSGTLNPALQDRYGRPKRDISTVIHILNDLLSATPQYSRGARISFEAPSTSAAAAAAAAAAAVSGSSSSTTAALRSKQLTAKHTHPCLRCAKSQPHTHNCAYGECNGHYTSSNSGSKTAIPSKLVCCHQHIGSSHTHVHSAAAAAAANERNVCSCRYHTVGETGEREREHTCQKCLVEAENLKTKSKLDQLRLVMQQRKQKREARKLKGAPYDARPVGATSASASDVLALAADVQDTNMTVAAAAATTPMSAPTAPPPPAQLNPTQTPPPTTAPPSEVSPNHIVEEVDTAA